ncbi:hypothetical protein R1flu_018694 [Riccia fluitans]|uniref:Uncharacterized protein n=1 Tax=Riccia fluitans TaxID=41844 RepID=A0ABD1ZGK4_9MARC
MQTKYTSSSHQQNLQYRHQQHERYELDFTLGTVEEEEEDFLSVSGSPTYELNDILVHRLSKSVHGVSKNFAQWMSVTTLLQEKDKQVLSSLLRIHKKRSGWLSHKALAGYMSAHLFYSLNTLKFYKWLGNNIKKVEAGNDRTMSMVMNLLSAPEPPTSHEVKQLLKVLRKHRADTKTCREDFSWAFDTAWTGYSMLLDKISVEERRLDEHKLRDGLKGSLMLKVLKGLSCTEACYQLQSVRPFTEDEKSLDEVLCLDKAVSLDFSFPTPMLDLLIRVLKNKAKGEKGEIEDDLAEIGSIQALVEAVKSEETHFSSLLLQLKHHVMRCFHSVKDLHTQILQLQQPVSMRDGDGDS